jgi:predicted  nucleic acid-binding Zn-ribbon protein
MTEEEIQQLEAEASTAGKEASSLESRLHDIPRIVDKLQHELNQAKARREIALTQLRKVKPLKLPQVHTLEQMLAKAKSQCPDRNPEEIKRLAGHVHACAATGSDSGESYYSRDDERMTGDARAVDDSHYDVQPPSPIPNTGLPPDPRVKMFKSYG